MHLLAEYSLPPPDQEEKLNASLLEGEQPPEVYTEARVRVLVNTCARQQASLVTPIISKSL